MRGSTPHRGRSGVEPQHAADPGRVGGAPKRGVCTSCLKEGKVQEGWTAPGPAPSSTPAAMPPLTKAFAPSTPNPAALTRGQPGGDGREGHTVREGPGVGAAPETH